MGIQFYGCFLSTNETQKILDWIKNKIPFCTAKRIFHPFIGIGIKCPNENDLPPYATDDDLEAVYEQIDLFEGMLVELSRNYPNLNFAFLEADCFGGTCIYNGYVLNNGVQILKIDEAEVGPQNLIKLLQPLDIKLKTDGYFEPLTRNYFDR